MLVLGRRVGESIVIGVPPNEIKVHVVKLNGSTASIGIEADRSLPIRREELQPREERQDAD